jgi:chromosome segregation ATPase
MLRIKVKNLKRRVADVSDSREAWKDRARKAESALEEAQAELVRLQAERERLEQTLNESKKKHRPPVF